MSKQRIIFVPQFPTSMRYSEWWYWKFPEEFEKAGFEVITLGNLNSRNVNPNYGYNSETQNFAPIQSSIAFEMSQIQEYMELKLRKDDILFLADLSFPGFFTNVLYHKPTPKMYAFCHATSLNDHDYFQEVRHSKYFVERGHAAMFDKIFVGSQYHYNKLYYTEYPKNLVVTGLPFPPSNIISSVDSKKKRFLISVSRPTIQKVDLDIERAVEEQYNEKIYRSRFHSWSMYCQALRESSVLLVTAREETFGYQIIDAILNFCIPVVPDNFSYPELVPYQLRYNNLTELMDILDLIKSGELGVPDILLSMKTRMFKFFHNIIEIMKEGSDKNSI